MVAARRITQRQGEPLDLAVWRETGRGPGAVEAVLGANAGAAAGAIGADAAARLLLPASAQAPVSAPTVNLWD